MTSLQGRLQELEYRIFDAEKDLDFAIECGDTELIESKESELARLNNLFMTLDMKQGYKSGWLR